MKNSKIKLGLLILSNTWGGGEQSVFNLAKNLDKKSLHVHLLTNDFLYERYRGLKGVDIVNLGSYSSGGKIKKIKTLYSIKRNLQKVISLKKLNVIHINLENSILLFSLSLSLPKIPMVVSLRGDEIHFYNQPKNLEQRIIRFTLNRIAGKPFNKLVAVSSWLIKELPGDFKSKIKVIHNGVDTNFFKPLGKEKTKNTILYVGRFTERKGIEDLIAVAKQLEKYKFLFVGKGPLDKLMVLKNTQNLGFKNYSDILELYNRVSLCAFPSYAEGMPTVGLEAMASGAPVVASRVGYSEFIENGVDGVLIKPGDRNQLKREIVRLLKDNYLRKKLSNNARKKALSFNIKKTAKNFLRLYQEVVSR